MNVEEQVANNDITTTQANTETNAQVSTETETSQTSVENEQKSTTISLTTKDLEKMLQSERSKAKYDILQEMGVHSVNEFKALKNTYDGAIKNQEMLQTELDEAHTANNRLQEELVVSKANIADDFKDDFLTLVKSKKTDANTYDDVVNEIIQRNPTWTKNAASVKIGTEKGVDDASTSTQKSDLSKKYPWLK